MMTSLVFFYIFCLIFELTTFYGYANPLPAPPEAKSTASISGGDIWSLIDRRKGSPDLVVPSLCPSPCQKLFRAQVANVTGTDCACRCTEEAPVFLQTVGQCVAKLDECRNNLQFSSSENSGDSRWIPLVSLPTPDNIIAPERTILWKESGIKQKLNTEARCNTTGVFYLKNDRSWQEASPKLLYLGWAENDTKLFWNGSISEAKYFEGTIIQLKLDCVSNEKNAHCIVFRVAGQTSPISAEFTQVNMFAHAQSRLETVLIILLAVLLFLSVFGSIILWNVCWRLKKTELISTLQMQFLYHVKQEKEKAAAEAAHRYQALARAAAAAHASQNSDIAHETDAVEGSQPMAVKRKLYFSAEFFEPHFMQNPPPMAEQFLHDLRRMIEIAKQKIHLRKHVPQLVSIPEEREEHYQSYMQLHNKNLSEPTNICTQNPSTSELPTEESSPKSTKSSDSGRDSMKESTSSEGSDSSMSPKEVKKNKVDSKILEKIEALKEGKNGLANSLKDGAGKVQEEEIYMEKAPVIRRSPSHSSKIPIANGFTKSPRLALKSNNLSTPKNGLTNGYSEAPPLPPRNPTMQDENSKTTPPPLPESDPPKSGIARRKAYAVFPTHDSMLKKSLPRRSKKRLSPSSSHSSLNSTQTTANGGIIETNM